MRDIVQYTLRSTAHGMGSRWGATVETKVATCRRPFSSPTPSPPHGASHYRRRDHPPSLQYSTIFTTEITIIVAVIIATIVRHRHYPHHRRDRPLATAITLILTTAIATITSARGAVRRVQPRKLRYLRARGCPTGAAS